MIGLQKIAVLLVLLKKRQFIHKLNLFSKLIIPFAHLSLAQHKEKGLTVDTYFQEIEVNTITDRHSSR